MIIPLTIIMDILGFMSTLPFYNLYFTSFMFFFLYHLLWDGVFILFSYCYFGIPVGNSSNLLVFLLEILHCRFDLLGSKRNTFLLLFQNKTFKTLKYKYACLNLKAIIIGAYFCSLTFCCFCPQIKMIYIIAVRIYPYIYIFFAYHFFWHLTPSLSSFSFTFKYRIRISFRQATD